ncbi:hypothetical protein CPC08DRAFT_344939 [Agrocybe pediades]|nr:hypothetical protein CPC08DRAFT_344939 [Agrocybe pediades]
MCHFTTTSLKSRPPYRVRLSCILYILPAVLIHGYPTFSARPFIRTTVDLLCMCHVPQL